MRQRYLRSLAVLLVALFVSLTLYSCGGSDNSHPTLMPTNTQGSAPPYISRSWEAWESGNKLDLNDVKVDNGYGTCSQNTFKWNGTIVVSQTNDGKYFEFPANNNLTLFDPYSNTAYEVYDNSTAKNRSTDTLVADKIDLNKGQATEFTWLENAIYNIDENYLADVSTLVKNHIILAYEHVQNDSGSAVNTVTTYDFDLVNQTVDNTTFDNYVIPDNIESLGVDNGSLVGVIPLKYEPLDSTTGEGEKTFAYINPNNALIEGTGVDTGYTTTNTLPATFSPHYPPTVANGHIYLSTINTSDNTSIFNVSDALSNIMQKTLTMTDMFDTDTNLSYENFGFSKPVASLDGKYVFVPTYLALPDPDNTSNTIKFYFVDKVDTKTNSIASVFSVYMIKGWQLRQITASPDGKYVYAIVSDSEEIPNFVELLVANTENGEEKAYKLYIDQNLEGVLDIDYTPSSHMEVTTDGAYLYIPLMLFNNQQGQGYLYIAEIPTSLLNNSVQ